MIADWLRQRITDYEPGVGRVFVQCGAVSKAGCGRVIPYYRLYGRHLKRTGCPHCGKAFFSPTRIPEWKAALWLLWGWVSRQGDPRMPLVQARSPFA